METASTLRPFNYFRFHFDDMNAPFAVPMKIFV